MRHYDLAVIGSGPAGQKAAIQAAKLGKRVAIVEKCRDLGGAQINTGTIPSKALREAAVYLSGHNKRALYGENSRVKREITIGDLISMSRQVINNQLQTVQLALERNSVDVISGAARFEGPNLLQITRANESELVTADHFVVATGTRPAKPDHVPFDGEFVVSSDDVIELDCLPHSIIVVGGGVIGTEYACIMATLGVHVILVEGRSQVLGFLDQEVAEAFQYHVRRMGVTLRLGEKVDSIEKIDAANGEQPHVQAVLESGKKLHAEKLLYAVGRQGVCAQLGLENVGLEYDDRERLKVDENYKTGVQHVYAAGDVIGFPALAATAMEQGRLAVCHMFGEPVHSMPELFPFGIYAVPEISMVGRTERQLTEAGIPYEAGVAQYSEVARGQLLGDEIGMLKILVHQESRKVLGVHCLGSGATELIHIGQTVMAFDGTVDFFVHNVFNFPTLAEAYRVAALNAVNKLQANDRSIRLAG